jgi:hypothetical protein
MIETKSFLKSKTITPLMLMVATFVAPKIFGVKIPKDTIESVLNVLGTIQPDAIAVITAAGAAWFRLTKVNFDKTRLTSKTVWLTTITALLAIGNAWGIDTQAAYDFGTTLAVLGEKYIAPIMGLLAVFGAVTAKKAIQVP